MKALLLKDWYMLIKYGRTLLIVLGAFIVGSAFATDTYFLLMYPVLLASVFSTSLISYDEKFGWLRYAETMPISRRLVVSEKYVITLLLSAAVLILTLLVRVPAIVAGKLDLSAFGGLVVLMAASSFVAPSLILPIMFKFGMEKGRIAYFIIIGFILALSVMLPDTVGPVALSGDLGLAALPLAAAIFALSWLLSIRFYQKREL